MSVAVSVAVVHESIFLVHAPLEIEIKRSDTSVINYEGRYNVNDDNAVGVRRFIEGIRCATPE